MLPAQRPSGLPCPACPAQPPRTSIETFCEGSGFYFYLFLPRDAMIPQ